MIFFRFQSVTFPELPSYINYSSNFLIYITDSPYGDVSGLPDPYMQNPSDMMAPQNHNPQPQQYEDGQDDPEFSPNGRNRRIIREIIV